MYSTAWQSLSFSPPLVGISAAIAIIAIAAYVFKGQKWNKHKRTPLSVNYHFTRRCNYECKFCFHTAKTSHVESTENAKTGIEMLVKAGMKKINFAGTQK
jgi:radical S-adenosyl methionine domain-containing protein 2